MGSQEALKFNKNQFINTPNKEIDNRWNALRRIYSANEVKKLQGTVKIEYSIFTVPCNFLTSFTEYSLFREFHLLSISLLGVLIN